MATATLSILAPSARSRRRPWHAYRPELEALIQRLVDILDAIDGDADSEPSLGFPERQPRGIAPGFAPPPVDYASSQIGWDYGRSDDREDDAGDNAEQPGVILHYGEAIPETRRVRRARA
ncbi:hypothetical protein [Enterovirga rhinocerotis]|uniref:Uncharacterized protein n=1 Tax=Enterovirga rhinocerotis TaxID=1339210 RepID=A0A4R7C6E1_9HYPH|nr:hypothetical protein [Enterovirga rhinocerotis]TDR93811.1 hypothetical protein EV668_1078 [Enterovirga rhinocerotis]